MKGLTDIPFVADVAKLVWGHDALTVLSKRGIDEAFLKRLIHFEARYWSVDNLLESLGGSNMVEMASGFSFRGLKLASDRSDVTYIDTDLPALIETKTDLIDQLIAERSITLQGELLVMPLNVLNEDDLKATIDKLPAGPVTIINEGLLMYLSLSEKAELCRIIRAILVKRGGYWITADIYIKKDEAISARNDHFSQFLQAHNVEDNKFDSFEQAERFFAEQGLRILKKADPVFGRLSSLKHVPGTMLQGLIAQAQETGRIRESWALVPA